MNNILKISLKRAFLFSLYELGMVLFFNVFSFFEKSNSILFISFVTFVSVFIFHFLILSFIEKSKLELSFRNFLNLTSYLFSSLLSSLMCWFLFNDEKGYVLIILSGFVVPSFLPSVVFFLMSLFKENDSKINAKPITQAVSVAPSEVVVQEEVFFTLENEYY